MARPMQRYRVRSPRYRDPSAGRGGRTLALFVGVRAWRVRVAERKTRGGGGVLRGGAYPAGTGGGGTVGDVDGRKRWKGVGHARRGCGRAVEAGAHETGGGRGMEDVDALLNFLIVKYRLTRYSHDVLFW